MELLKAFAVLENMFISLCWNRFVRGYYFVCQVVMRHIRQVILEHVCQACFNMFGKLFLKISVRLCWVMFVRLCFYVC